MGLGNAPHKVMAFGRTAQSGMGALPRGHCMQLGLSSALTKFRGRDVMGKKNQAQESTQPACSLDSEFTIYLFSQVHRIELTILLSSWHTISSLVHVRPFYFFVFSFVPFITHS